MTMLTLQLVPAMQYGGGLGPSPALLGAVLAVVMIIILAVFAGRYRKTPPNTVLVISGGRGQAIRNPDGTVHQVGYRLVKGGGTFVVPVIERVDQLILENASITVGIGNLRDSANEPHRLTGVVQVRVSPDDRALNLAVEQFLNKTPDEIAAVAGLAVDSHLRTMVAHRGIEAIQADLPGFNTGARESVGRDLAHMGLLITSCNLRVEGEDAM